MTRAYWISLPYATFGLRSYDGVIIEAPPIARWTRGCLREFVLAYYRERGATVVELEVS